VRGSERGEERVRRTKNAVIIRQREEEGDRHGRDRQQDDRRRAGGMYRTPQIRRRGWDAWNRLSAYNTGELEKSRGHHFGG